MRSYARGLRVAEQIQRALSTLIAKEVSDPRLAMAVVTGVEMSPDLKFARIYVVSTGGGATPEDVIKGFESAHGFLKRSLAPGLGLRYMPELRFFYDTSFDYGSRIDHILEAVKTENESDH